MGLRPQCNGLLTGVTPPFFIPRPPGPVRRRLGPVAADGHATPAPGVGLRAVEERQHAGRTRARPGQPEILIADQVRRHGSDRLEQLRRALPAVDPSQEQATASGLHPLEASVYSDVSGYITTSAPAR